MTQNGSTLDRDIRLAGNGLLLALVSFTVFAVPLFGSGSHEFLYSVSFTAIFLISALAIDRQRRTILGLAIVATIAEGATHGLGLTRLHELSRVGIVAFFVIMVGALIFQVARTKVVDARVIMAAVTGYLMLGLAFSLIIQFVVTNDPAALKLPGSELATPTAAHGFSDVLYYGFVTFTTVGYGDVTPLKPYAKSLATLIGVGGQLYIAIIIALLVGKVSSKTRAD